MIPHATFEARGVLTRGFEDVRHVRISVMSLVILDRNLDRGSCPIQPFCTLTTSSVFALARDQTRSTESLGMVFQPSESLTGS